MPPPAARLDLRALQRLPGRASAPQRLFTGYRLWLAPDFLLQLKTLPFSQEAQRFSYRDIQALQIAASSRATVYNVVLGAPLLLLVVVLVTIAVRSGETSPGTLIAAGVLLALLLVNVARGPTCRCNLQTALGAQALPSLSRRRTARRAVAQITERIEAAQSGNAEPGTRQSEAGSRE